MYRKTNLWIISAIMIAILTTGCSSTDATTATQLSPTATATPEQLAELTQPPTPTTTPVPTYPLSLTDMMQQSIEIATKPSRIVSISPTATEMLYAVEGVAIGRDEGSTFSEDVNSLPSVGGAYNPNLEAIVALNPDLILIEALTQGHLTQMLSSIQVPIVAVKATSIQDVKDGLTLMGAITNQKTQAENAIKTLEIKIETAMKPQRDSHSVLILIADAQHNTYAAMPESYPGEIANSMNLSNVSAGLEQSGPYPGFTLFSPEQALTSNPDIILAISPAPAPAPKLTTMLPMIPGYNSLSALTKGRVAEIDPALFLSAPGPRIADAIVALGNILDSMEFS
jgi:iron complex transport system substrate-binding protein